MREGGGGGGGRRGEWSHTATILIMTAIYNLQLTGFVS